MEYEESHVVRKESCPKCGSRDNLARYTDGHGHCFSQGCGHRERGDGEAPTPNTKRKPMSSSLAEYQEASVEALKPRFLTEETCRTFGVRVGQFKGQKAHFYPYFNEGNVIAAKVRMAGKEFTFLGEPKKSGMFGQQLWNKGKMIVVTEGEIDAMSVSQVQNHKWPVVSIPNGAGGAKKDMAKNLEYFNAFESIILMFDMDEPGRNAAKEVAELFPPGKCKIASLPLKDPNECLMKGKPDAIIQAIWNAKAYRPDGLVTVEDVEAELDLPVEQGLPWFLPTLTKHTFGRRWGEVYGLGAGTGIGKTDFFTQQIAYDIEVLKEKVGLIFLEQKPLQTLVRIAGKMAGKRFHVPNGTWTVEERKLWIAKLKGQVVLYDSFGETEWDVVKAKIRYMAVSEGIRVFYLDHLTAMADTADEKGSLEQITKEMAGLANELQIIVTFISHLSTPEGKSHEEGGHVSIKHFKGSRAIGFWSYFMFGMERDQQSDDPDIRGTTLLRILKDRFTGDATGILIYLGYDRDTGRMYEKAMPAKANAYKDETETEAEALAF